MLRWLALVGWNVSWVFVFTGFLFGLTEAAGDVVHSLMVILNHGYFQLVGGGARRWGEISICGNLWGERWGRCFPTFGWFDERFWEFGRLVCWRRNHGFRSFEQDRSRPAEVSWRDARGSATVLLGSGSLFMDSVFFIPWKDWSFWCNHYNVVVVIDGFGKSVNVEFSNLIWTI